jgi:hypothetical protein
MANAKVIDYLTQWMNPNVYIKNGILYDKYGIPLTEEAANSEASTGLARWIEGADRNAEKMEELNYGTRIDTLDALDNPIWKNLSKTEKISFIKEYAGNVDAMVRDLNDIANIGAAPDIQLPTSSEIYADIDAELNPAYTTARSRLDEEASLMRRDYQDQLQSSADLYNQRASGLLSNQYLSNAQTYDALQSDMRKARQNALEAGASAGIRLAGNVNALLTAQNKQSQTAMDTSNALAEMLLQQRNAAAGIRSDYRNYMSDVNQRRTDLDTQQRTERENLYNQRYNNSVTDYNTQMERYENKFNALDPSNRFKSYGQAYYQK